MLQSHTSNKKSRQSFSFWKTTGTNEQNTFAVPPDLTHKAFSLRIWQQQKPSRYATHLSQARFPVGCYSRFRAFVRPQKTILRKLLCRAHTYRGSLWDLLAGYYSFSSVYFIERYYTTVFGVCQYLFFKIHFKLKCRWIKLRWFHQRAFIPWNIYKSIL